MTYCLTHFQIRDDVKKKIWVTAVGVLIVAFGLSAQLSVFSVNSIGVKKTLLLWGQRDQLKFLDSPTAYCARKGASSLGLFESGSKQFCEFGVMGEVAAHQERIILRLPFSQLLFDASK